MAAAAPWSVKGIDPKAREVAKDLARRSGMTLGEWLNRVILEDDVPEEVSSQAHFGERLPERPRLRSEPPRQTTPSAGEFGRIAFALDRLTDRIEAAETRTGFAVAGVEHSVRQAVARIDTAERAQAEIQARLDPAAEPAGPRSPEALRVLDNGRTPASLPQSAAELMERLGQRLADAEGHTTGMLEALRGALAALDLRLGAVEDTGGSRLEALGASLTDQLDAVRQDFAARLAGAGTGPSEARLAEMAQHIAAAEERSTRAIETMGREVLTLAESLSRRLQAGEQRSAAAITQVGGDVARFAGAVEARLGRSEQVQADALEKLGAEMGRISERLTERLLSSERRAAQAIDDVGEQMSRVTERFERRQERATSDLAERIRQSETRTLQLLGDHGRRLDDPLEAAPFASAPFAGAEAEAVEIDPAEPAPASSWGAPATVAGALVVKTLDPPSFSAEDFDDAEAFAPIPEPGDEIHAGAQAGALADDEEEADGERALSTREVIDQARAAARAAQFDAQAQAQAEAQSTLISEPPVTRRDTAARRGFFGVSRRRSNSTLQTALMVAGGAAFLSVGAAGVVLLEGPPAAVQAMTPRAAVALTPTLSVPSRPVVDPSVLADRYTQALTDLRASRPGALAGLKSVADAGHAPAQLFLAKLYEKGEAGVVVNPAEARKWVARAAEGGDASAMHQLAVYDFRGEGSVQNLAGAAMWFRRAAERGVVDSQYNLALLYRSGSGVDRNLAEAYRWFSVAAASGDPAARAAAAELKPQLSPTELAGAEQAADQTTIAVAQAPTRLSAVAR